MLEIKARYTSEGGKVDNGHGSLLVGGSEGEFSPYDLLLGSLSGCFHATLESILAKQHLNPERVDYIITGEKRKEVPTTLAWVKMDITVTGDVDQKQMLRSIELAGKYCSIHETLSKVAEMQHEVHFVNE